MARRIQHPVIQLATDELFRGPWIYGRHVLPPAADQDVKNGDLVEVLDHSGRFLGHALYNGSSDVRLRWLSRGKKSDLDRPREFFGRRLRAADRLRRRALDLEAVTDAYRIVHAEGDDLPGVIVDRLGSVIVCEHHALGFWELRGVLEETLSELYPDFPILHRVPKGARRSEDFDPFDELDGPTEVPITEHGMRHFVRPGGGHKTGWFCDQRDNRLSVGRLAKGRRVLDLFCNQGGFALQAARAGARDVFAVDLDESVLELAQASAEENRLPVQFEHADAFHVMRHIASGPDAQRPELVVLDPHKIVAGKKQLDEGKRKYGDLQALALEILKPGGLLATFSCSGALDLPSFLGIIFGAARRVDREVKLLSVMGAGPDHPQRPDWPRSRYLKGALLVVD